MKEIGQPIKQWDEGEDRLREKIEATLKPEDKLLLVLSDSHGDLASVIDIITRWENRISAVLFLGDGAEELLEAAYIFPDLPFYGVTGNNDPHIAPNNRLNFPLENVVEIAGRRIYLTHGHIAHPIPLAHDRIKAAWYVARQQSCSVQGPDDAHQQHRQREEQDQKQRYLNVHS